MGELFIKLEKLQNISGTNDKKKFIKENRNNQLFLDTLEFLLNPYKITNISKKKINKKVRVIDNQLKDLNEFYDYLINKSTGKDRDISIIQAFIREHGEFREQLEGLACKSMRLGVQGKLVNQALGYNLIPQFSPMLGDSYFKNENKVKGKFILTTKLDGTRILLLKENGKAKAMSRQGQIIEGLDDIIQDVEEMNFNNGVLDGELIAEGNFVDSAEMYKETMKRSRIKGKKKGLKVMVYDYIENINNFHNGIDNTPCIERKSSVENLIKQSNCKHIEYLEPLYVGDDKEEIIKQLKIAEKNNDEGIMLNTYHGKYECKRSKELLKCKLFKDADVLVTDVLEGEGRLEGVLGKIEIKFKYKGKVYINYVGSGFSDEERNYYWKNKDKLIGKVITINYFEISKNKQGSYGLRFGTWKGKEYIRFDKEGIDDTNIE